MVFTKHFHPYLLGREFILRTDYGSLTWLPSFKEPEGQLARWLEKLQEFNFTIVHRPGKSDRNADALSQLPCHQSGKKEDRQVSQVTITAGPDPEQPLPDMQTLQKEDPDIFMVLRAKEAAEKPEVDVQKAQSLETRRLLQLWEQPVIHDGILFRRWENHDGTKSVHQLVVPKSQRRKMLHELHDGVSGGQLGEAKVLNKLKERFHWPGHATDVRNWCKTCGTCAQCKHPAPRNRAQLQTISVGYPMQTVGTDILGPFPVSESGLFHSVG